MLECFFSLLDISGLIAGDESKSPFFKVAGLIAWLLVLTGIVWFLIKWFP